MKIFNDLEMFRVVFKALLAVLVVAFSATFLMMVSFRPSDQLSEQAGVIVGFVTGTAFASILGFYFGSSDRPKERKPDDLIK
jgi:uncharacterized membrane protein (UPF0182 family)